jgi:hypothetical protein
VADPSRPLVGAEEFDRLRRLRSAGPEAGLASLAGGWDGSAELAELIDASPRRGRRAGVQFDQAWRTSSTPSAIAPCPDAISELLRPRPGRAYVRWLDTVPRQDPFTSAVTIGELFKGAYRRSRPPPFFHGLEL